MVSHAMFVVNGCPTNVPSFQVSVDDIITLKDNNKKKVFAQTLSEQLKTARCPSWLLNDPVALTGKILSLPSDEELKQEVFDPKMIIEFYSR